MRKILLLLLLFIGWAVIFWPYYADDIAPGSSLFSSANPSTKPFQPAWQNTERLQVRHPGAADTGGLPVTSAPIAGRCGSPYTVQAGDTLGEIARDCGLTLGELLAANPTIQNPNRVYPGQQITLPDALAGRGGVVESLDTDTVSIAEEPAAGRPGQFRPGSEVQIEAGGLPPNTPVRIGLGLTGSGYTVLDQSRTDADGRISMIVTLPAGARPGDTAFIMVTTRGLPSVQRMSETFYIIE